MYSKTKRPERGTQDRIKEALKEDVWRRQQTTCAMKKGISEEGMVPQGEGGLKEGGRSGICTECRLFFLFPQYSI